MKFKDVVQAFAPKANPGPRFEQTPFFHTPGIPTTYTAQRTSQIADDYADVAFVYEIIHDLSTKGAALPLKVYQIDPETGERAEDKTHPAYQLFRHPNDYYDENEFRQFLFASRYIWGEHFIVKVRDRNGRPVELWPLRPERMREVIGEDGRLMGWIMNYQTNPTALLPEDVIVGRDYHPRNDYRGLSPVAALRYQIELGRDAEGANIDFWSNNAMPRGVLQVQKTASSDSLTRLAEQFRQLLAGSGNRYRIPVMEQGMDFKPLQLPPADAEWLNTAKITRERVAQSFGYWLPESFARVTPDELRRARYADGVAPTAHAIEKSIELQLMPDFGVEAFPEFALGSILEADFPSMVTALKDAVYSAQLTPNEARRKLNLPPQPGGDQLYVPLNLSPVEDVAAGNAVPRAADSSGGMGGDQGRTGSSTGVNSFKRISPNYSHTRDRRLASLAKALDNRIRGLLKKEASAIRGGKASAALPSAQEITDIVRQHSAQMATLLDQFLNQSGEAGYNDAADAVGMAGATDSARYAAGFADRAAAVSDVFQGARTQDVLDLLGQAQNGQLDMRGFMNAVSDLYGAQFSSFGERLARTEVAYAHELAARSMWQDMGAPFLVWNFGGGPCTTGACEDANGQVIDASGTFDVGEFGAMEGPPAHNYCTCFTTPEFGDGWMAGDATAG